MRYRAELSGKLKIMSKKEMFDEGYSSPNHADALMLTFIKKDETDEADDYKQPAWEEESIYMHSNA